MSEAFDYDGLRDDVDDVLSDLGQPVVIQRIANTGKAWEPTQTAQGYPTKGVVGEYESREIDGVNVLRGDFKVLVAAGPLGSLVPMVTDKIVIGGRALSIVNVRITYPAGVAVLYEVQARA